MSGLGESIKYFSQNSPLNAEFLDDLFMRLHSTNADLVNISSFLTTLDLVDHQNIVYDELSKFLIHYKFKRPHSKDENIIVFELNNINLVKMLPSILLLGFMGYKSLVSIRQTKMNNFAQMMQISYCKDTYKLSQMLDESNFSIVDSHTLVSQKNFEEVIRQSNFGARYEFINLISLPFNIKALFLDHSVLTIPHNIKHLREAEIFTLDNQRQNFINGCCELEDEIFRINDAKNLYKTIIAETDQLDNTDPSLSWIVKCAQNILNHVYKEDYNESLSKIQNALNTQSFTQYLCEMREKLLS